MANVYKNAKVDLTTTNNTTIYTCPVDSTAIIKSILVCEDSGNADTISITLTAGSDVFNLFKTKSIAANGTTELITQPIIVASEEIIKAQAATGNRLHIIISLLEINF